MPEKLFVVECAVLVSARSKARALEIVEGATYLSPHVQNVDARVRKLEPYPPLTHPGDKS